MKKLAITMGDPGGVGPEIVLKALNSPEVRKRCIPIVIGDAVVMEAALKLLDRPEKLKIIQSPEEAMHKINTVDLIDACVMKTLPASSSILKERGRAVFLQRGAFIKNKPTEGGGKASASCIKKAVELAMNKLVDGIVTAPISKEALRLAGVPWPGHTEMLADMTNTAEYSMMLTGGPLRVVLVTIHTALKDVPALITRKKVEKTIYLAKRACDMLGLRNPRIAVAGLNPHAGEAGLFGDEEMKKIVPAVRNAVKLGIPVSGPYPPDTVFHKAYQGDVDIVVCMYHDQGLIPLKMIAFDKGVNITVGLPFIRTSPDHGTAYDIAWKGMASPSSMIEAIKLAVRLKV
jgi:4-hydroxythreonine-4-phosphate dehydrogenase